MPRDEDSDCKGIPKSMRVNVNLRHHRFDCRVQGWTYFTAPKKILLRDAFVRLSSYCGLDRDQKRPASPPRRNYGTVRARLAGGAVLNVASTKRIADLPFGEQLRFMPRHAGPCIPPEPALQSLWLHCCFLRAPFRGF